MSKRVLIDTGCWLAWLDPKDPYHSVISGPFQKLDDITIVLPWPIIYETLRTQILKRSRMLDAFDRVAKAKNTEIVDDSPYRERAFRHALDMRFIQKRAISMVDAMCRLFVDNPDIRLDAVWTMNQADFLDVCMPRGIEIEPFFNP